MIAPSYNILLIVYTQSEKKRTMKPLASPGTQGQGQVNPAGSYFEIQHKVYLSTLLCKRNATFHRAFLLRLSVGQFYFSTIYWIHEITSKGLTIPTKTETAPYPIKKIIQITDKDEYFRLGIVIFQTVLTGELKQTDSQRKKRTDGRTLPSGLSPFFAVDKKRYTVP